MFAYGPVPGDFMAIKLFVGDRNYSSWSLRAWLVMKWSGLSFVEEFISLDQPGYGEGKILPIKAASPSGRVPAIETDGLNIWDSLAIAEWAAEIAPLARLWPVDAGSRAQARAVTCEMHSGFFALRRDLPMNIRRRCTAQDWPRDTFVDLERMEEIWRQYRTLHSKRGPYLFGARSIADAFFTPVATRMRTYSVTLNDAAQRYCQTLLDEPAFKEWETRALVEWRTPFSRAEIDSLYPGADAA
jgi:glutathione S-transferase